MMTNTIHKQELIQECLKKLEFILEHGDDLHRRAIPDYVNTIYAYLRRDEKGPSF